MNNDEVLVKKSHNIDDGHEKGCDGVIMTAHKASCV